MDFTRLDEFLTGLEKRGKSGTDCAVYVNGALAHRHIYGLANREQDVPISQGHALSHVFHDKTDYLRCDAAAI